MTVICPNCGNEYEQIGVHLSSGNVCYEPQLSDGLLEVLIGNLMGDGCIDKCDKNPNLVCKMVNKEYLDYLDSLLGVFSTGVSLSHTAEELAESNRKRGFRPNAKSDDYSDAYTLRTRNLSQLEKLSNWYSSGEKLFPKNLELTPTILKHWYVCDGHYSIKKESNRGNIIISLNNERENKDKIEKYFRGIDVEIGRWREYDAGSHIDCSAVFHADETEQLFEYMGEPLPGFQYKWPANYRD